MCMPEDIPTHRSILSRRIHEVIILFIHSSRYKVKKRRSLGACYLVGLGKVRYHGHDTVLLHHHLLVLSEEWLEALRGVLVGAAILR